MQALPEILDKKFLLPASVGEYHGVSGKIRIEGIDDILHRPASPSLQQNQQNQQEYCWFC